MTDNVTARINNNGKLIIVIDPTVKGTLASTGKSNILATARWLDIGALDGADGLEGVSLNLMLIKKLGKQVKKALKNAAPDDDEDEVPAETTGKRKSRNVAVEDDDDAPAKPAKRKTSKTVEEATDSNTDEDEIEKMLRQQRGKLRRLVQAGGLPEAYKNLKAYAEKYFEGFDEDNLAEELKAVLDNEKWLKLAETLRTEHKLNFKMLVEKKLEELGEDAPADDDDNTDDNADDNTDDNADAPEIDMEEVLAAEHKRMRGLIKTGLPTGYKNIRAYAKEFFAELADGEATAETFQELLDDEKWAGYAEKLNDAHDIDMVAIIEKKIEEMEDAPQDEPEAKPTKKPLAKGGKKTANTEDDDTDFVETKTKTTGKKIPLNKNAKGNVQPIATSKRPADKVKTKRS